MEQKDSYAARFSWTSDPEVDSGLFVCDACFDSGYMYCVSVLGLSEGFPYFLRGVIRLLKSILVLLSWLVVSRDSDPEVDLVLLLR